MILTPALVGRMIIDYGFNVRFCSGNKDRVLILLFKDLLLVKLQFIIGEQESIRSNKLVTRNKST